MRDETPNHRTPRFILYVFITFGVLATTSSLVARGRAPSGIDFTQDYVSARSFADGDSAYRPIDELLTRYDRPTHSTHLLLKSNPHPPVAVLLTLPFAGLEFEPALMALWWTQLLALAVAWVACFAIFRPAVPGWFWALGGGAFGLWAPFWQGMGWGHPVGVLALCTAAVWAFGRAGRPFAFGFALATAILIRPLFAMHVVLACGWTMRQQMKCAAGLVVGGLIPFAGIGITPWEWYRLASHAGGFVSWNGSIPAVLELGPRGAQLLYAAAAAVLALLRWRGLCADATIAVVGVVALLFYPLAWPIYDASLIPVVAWVLARADTSTTRAAVMGVAVYLILRTLPDIKAGENGAGLAEMLARNKTWFQLFARGVLLSGVVATYRRTRPCRRASASESADAGRPQVSASVPF